MKNFIRKKLIEALNMPTGHLPKTISITADELSILKAVTWKDVVINEKDNDGHSKLFMEVTFTNHALNNVSSAIDFTIELRHDTYYQPHMFLSPSIQGISLGPKILKAFIMDFGHIYAGKGRTLNDDANKMLSKLTNDPELESFSDDIGLLVMKKGNPDKDTLLKIIN
jgi:hypothetical protein